MRLIIIILGLVTATMSQAQDFDRFFENKTLRLDYIFSGNSEKQNISLDELIYYPSWAGKRSKLSINPLKGNGIIRVKDSTTGELIYTNSFSSLFQEWLDTDEAKFTARSFENTFLIPYPRNKVDVTISLYDLNHKRIAKLTHVVDPNDILIRPKGIEEITPYRIVHNSKVTNPINVAILAEGYTAQEINVFYKDAELAVKSILEHEPFKSYQHVFNFVAVGSISIDTGVSIPHQNIWRNTAFSASFDTFYSPRYLTTQNVKKVHDELAGIPYEHIIIIANTQQYGGGGIYNSYTLTAAHHEDFGPVVVHEFGHSFGGLADEYFYEDDVLTNIYPLDIEPWEPNITTLIHFEKKWKNLLNANTPIPTPIDKNKQYPIGVYEGGGYSSKGIYRPALDCRMKTNTYPSFCGACQQAIENLIKFYIED